MTTAARRATWSQALTVPIARSVPRRWRREVLVGVKAVHTVIFASVAVAIAAFAWDGARGRTGRRAAVALGVAIGESAVYASNNQVCPLTPLAEALGAEDGSVADLFLPSWLSRRIPLIGSTALLLGMVLHARALVGAARRRRGGS